MSIKLKWTVDAAPVGRYRSFERRGWPTAEFQDGETAAQIRCRDEYVPARVRTGEHAELEVLVADYSPRRTDPTAAGFVWRRLKTRARTLDEAKALAAKAFADLPHFLPQGFTS